MDFGVLGLEFRLEDFGVLGFWAEGLWFGV